MKFLPILFVMILVSCGNKSEPPRYLNDCADSDLNLDDGIVVSDTLGLFSFQIPDSSWNPIRTYDDDSNGLTAGDFSKGYYRVFNVRQSYFEGKWNWDEELQKISSDYDVVEMGPTSFQNQNTYYHLIKDKADNYYFYSYMLTYLDTSRKRNYTLMISVESENNHWKKICEMKPLLESVRFVD